VTVLFEIVLLSEDECANEELCAEWSVSRTEIGESQDNLVYSLTAET
jgi:hypothetical protein